MLKEIIIEVSACMTLVLTSGNCIYRKRHIGSMPFDDEAIIRVIILEARKVPGALTQYL